MILFQHPIWHYVAPYAHLDANRDNLDFLQMTDELRSYALDVLVNCVACGAPIRPMRARAKSDRARIGGTELERRLFYAPTCPTDINPGCSRTHAAQAHKSIMKVALGAVDVVETYNALCLKEPYLELILLGLKSLETRTKCLFKKGGTYALSSSQTYDKKVWDDPISGGKLDAAAKARALAGMGKLRGLVEMGGFRVERRMVQLQEAA